MSDAAVLDTLAAAWAEPGRFDEAVSAARKAVDLAAKDGHNEPADVLHTHQRSFEARRPRREPPKP